MKENNVSLSSQAPIGAQPNQIRWLLDPLVYLETRNERWHSEGLVDWFETQKGIASVNHSPECLSAYLSTHSTEPMGRPAGNLTQIPWQEDTVYSLPRRFWHTPG